MIFKNFNKKSKRSKIKIAFWAIAILFVVLLLIYLFKNNTNSNNTAKPSTNEQTKNLKPSDIALPENFFFGTGSSDFQSTGGNGKSDWDEYVKNMKPPQKGPGQGNDFYNRYQEDFILAEKIGIQMHRFSLDWSRIEPEDGQYDMQAVEKYKEIFRFMKLKKIEPMICLNHTALPIWFAKKGGWENKNASFYYGRYAEFVAKNIGIPLKIKWWLTINEPYVILMSYLSGNWPPYKKIQGVDDVQGLTEFTWLYGYLLDSHRLAYRKIHKTMESAGIKPMVGCSAVGQNFEPYDPTSKNDVAVYNIINSLNTLSFQAFIGIDQDFIGVDYYHCFKLKSHLNPLKAATNMSEVFTIEWIEKDMPYGDGLYNLVKKFSHLNLPIIITENGIDDQNDTKRAQFILTHLQAVSKAKKDGINIIGYIYWSLTDNWEWEGFDSYYGLIEVNRKTMGRTIRPSAYVYAEIIKNHAEQYKKIHINKD